MFSACSLSKVVTAYTAIRMWMRDGLNFDTPLSEILPHPTVNDQRAAKITLRMILSHSSGLSHTIRVPTIEFEPGERFNYSSGGFAYLQKVIEHLTDVPFARYDQTHTLAPLGMADSSFTWPDDPGWLIAKSQSEAGHPLVDDRPAEESSSCAGSLLSTPDDIAKFLDAVTRDQAVVDIMMHRQIPITPTPSWGMGWGIEHGDESGDRGWQWGWSRTGFRNIMIVDPTHRSGLVLFTNGVRGYELWKRIADATVNGCRTSIDWVLPDL